MKPTLLLVQISDLENFRPILAGGLRWFDVGAGVLRWFWRAGGGSISPILRPEPPSTSCPLPKNCPGLLSPQSTEGSPTALRLPLKPDLALYFCFFTAVYIVFFFNVFALLFLDLSFLLKGGHAARNQSFS